MSFFLSPSVCIMCMFDISVLPSNSSCGHLRYKHPSHPISAFPPPLPNGPLHPSLCCSLLTILRAPGTARPPDHLCSFFPSSHSDLWTGELFFCPHV
jgi:hypothetical protein